MTLAKHINHVRLTSDEISSIIKENLDKSVGEEITIDGEDSSGIIKVSGSGMHLTGYRKGNKHVTMYDFNKGLGYKNIHISIKDLSFIAGSIEGY